MELEDVMSYGQQSDNLIIEGNTSDVCTEKDEGEEEEDLKLIIKVENSSVLEPELELELEIEPENYLKITNEERNVSHLAKAFIFNSVSNQWNEIAAGICSPEPSEDGKVFAIRLRAKEDTSLVLFTAYLHQEQEIRVVNETVLTWITFDGDEAALSFESILGCEEFWELICRFHGRSFEEWKIKQLQERLEKEKKERENEALESCEDVIDEEMIKSSTTTDLVDSDNLLPDEKGDDFYDYCENSSQVPKIEINFPGKPEISNLSEIEEGLYKAIMIPSLRRPMADILLQYQYIPILLEIFQHCEEFELQEELTKLFNIFKLFFLLNGQDVVKELMNEENVLGVAGVMEYDPLVIGYDLKSKNVYRSFLSDENKFKQVIPLNNFDTLDLIHQTFRLQYFKDVILAKILDEESSASFILLIRLNHMAIINSLDNDPEVLEVMRELLKSPNTILEDQINILKFFKEFLTIAKTVSLRKSLQIHQATVVTDFMRFITRVLNRSETSDFESVKEAKILAIGLFTNFIQHDPSQIRNYLIQTDSRNNNQELPKNLLSTIIDMFTNPETCSPIRWQLVTSLRILLDTFNPVSLPSVNNNNANTNNNNNNLQLRLQLNLNPQILAQALSQKSGEDFLNYFYPDYAGKLLKPLIDFDKTAFALDNNNNNNNYFFKDNLSSATCEILFHLGELLCSFINQHKYRIKYLVLRNLILQNIFLLFKCREKHLQLTGLRVFRATLAVEDEFYFRFFIQNRSFGSLFSLYRAAGGSDCDNLVTSAILEIFEFIRVPKDSLKALIRHLGTVYRLELETLGPTSVFKGILETEDRIDRESSLVSFASSQTSESIDQTSDQEMLSPQPRKQITNFNRNEDPDRDIDEDYFSNVEDEFSDSNDDLNVELSHNPDSDKNYFTKQQQEEEDQAEEDHFELLFKKQKDPGSPSKK